MGATEREGEIGNLMHYLTAAESDEVAGGEVLSGGSFRALAK